MSEEENISSSTSNNYTEEVDKQSQSVSDSTVSENVQMAEIDARKKNLRTLCGCLFGVLILFVIGALYPVYLSFSTVEKVTGASADALSSGMRNVLNAVEKFVNKKPSVNVIYGAQFVCSFPQNKFVVAQVDEKIDVSPEFQKYNILSASLRLTVKAHYEYYIPLRGIKFDVRKSRDDGKFYFTFYFDSLKCNTPVKFTEITRKVNPSNFSDDVNNALEDYQKNAFPSYLVARAENSQNMMSASAKARESIKEYIYKNIMPYAGIHNDEIGDVSIVFNTLAFDTFKDGIKNETRN